jgi:hypothetical protein
LSLAAVLDHVVIRFPDSYAVQGERWSELWLYLLKEVCSDIFGSGISFFKTGKIVQGLVVEFGYHVIRYLLEFPEINTQTGFIHFPGCNMHLNPVIVAM